MNVLVVDDNRDTRDLIELVLRMEPDIDVRSHPSPTEAMGDVAWADVVVTDLMMPHLSGVDFIEAIHATVVTDRPRIVVLTAMGSIEWVYDQYPQLLELADGVFAKGHLDVGELRRLVAQ